MKQEKHKYSEAKELTINKVVSPYGHPEYSMMKSVKTYRQIEDKPEVVHQQGDLFDVVFSVNPRTKLPDGDLAMYMGDNVSPEVRDFIKQNLMKSFDSNETGGKYNGLDDDDIQLYTRGHDESIDMYRSRLYGIVKQQSAARIKASQSVNE